MTQVFAINMVINFVFGFLATVLYAAITRWIAGKFRAPTGCEPDPSKSRLSAVDEQKRASTPSAVVPLSNEGIICWTRATALCS